MIHLDKDIRYLAVIILMAVVLGSLVLAKKRPNSNVARVAACAIGATFLWCAFLFIFTDHKGTKPELFRLFIGILSLAIGAFSIWGGITRSPEEINAFLQRDK